MKYPCIWDILLWWFCLCLFGPMIFYPIQAWVEHLHKAQFDRLYEQGRRNNFSRPLPPKPKFRRVKR